MEKLRNQNKFLMYCIFSIVFLLTVCYFGINKNIKGTFAVNSTANCPAGYTDKIEEYNGITYCGNSRLTVVEDGLACMYTGTVPEDGYECKEEGTASEDGPIYVCTTSNLSYCSVVLSTDDECPEYTITYNANGGSVTPNSVTVSCDDPIRLPEITRTGYTLLGWAESPNSTNFVGTQASPGVYDYLPQKNVTLYAIWKANSYTVEFDANGGSVDPTSKSVTYDSTYGDLPIPLQIGYTFVGWYTSKTGGTNITADSIVLITSLQTLYARWIEDIQVATIPTISSYCKTGLVYNGSSQTIVKSAGTGYTWTAGTTRTNAGSQDVTATLKNGFKWSDNSTEPKIIRCGINKAIPTIIVTPTTLLVESGSTSDFTIQGSVIGDFRISSSSASIVTVSQTDFNNVPMNVSQKVTVNGISVGSSTITVEFTPNDMENFNVASSKTVAVTVIKGDDEAVVPLASIYCKTGLVYNGSSQTIVKSAGTGYTWTAGTTRTNAGSQDVTATLNSGYKWSDGTTTDKTISCSIAKANAKLELTENNTLLKVDASIQINYLYDGDGQVSCESKNNSVAICEVKDDKLVITSKATGNTEILLKAAAGSNYNAASTKTVSVVVEENAGDEETPSESTFTAMFDANGGVLSNNSSKSCTTTLTSCDITNLPSAIRDGYTFNGWGLVETCDSGELSKITLDKNKTYYACWVKNANPPIVDDDGNVEDNVQTGNVVFMLILCLGLLAIGYAYYYFKSIKQK